MSQEHCSKYTHLTPEERGKIEILLRQKKSYREIGREIGRSGSTISREYRRNSEHPIRTRVNRPRALKVDSRHYRGRAEVDMLRASKERFQKRQKAFIEAITYDAIVAGQKAVKRRSIASAHGLKLDRPEYQALIDVFKTKAKVDKWTPENFILHNRRKREILAEKGEAVFNTIFTEDDRTIYPDISISAFYAYTRVHPELKKYLIHKGKHYRYQKPATKYNSTNRTKHSIKDRPEIIEQKQRLGDLEGDTIVGKDQKDRIVTHIDRVSKIGALGLRIGYDSYQIYQQSVEDIKRVYGQVETITYDNGSEFADWRPLENKLGATVYFADPYSPWQRGANENFNGLIRRFIPKGTDLKKLSKDDILKIESSINNRPRKCFGGLSPLENQRLLHLGE